MRRLLTILALTLTVLTAGALTAPSAHAAQSTLHSWPGGSKYLACKRAATGPYGPVWHVQLVLAHNPNERVRHLRAHMNVQRFGTDGRYHAILPTTLLATDRVGQWDVAVTTASQLGRYVNGRWYADRWTWGYQDETGFDFSGELRSFSSIANC